MSQRIFLGWDQPCLPEVVRWLWQRREDGGAWDLSNLLLVTPGSRAQRRLLELLANQADGCVLIPPRVVTVGALPQVLYDADSPVAAPTRALLAWVKVLQEADRTVLAAVAHYLPADDQFAEWLALARCGKECGCRRARSDDGAPEGHASRNQWRKYPPLPAPRRRGSRHGCRLPKRAKRTLRPGAAAQQVRAAHSYRNGIRSH